MHVGADPHNPHTDGGDDHRNNAHSTSHCIYFWLADLAAGGLLMPTYIWNPIAAMMPKNKNTTDPMIKPSVFVVIYLLTINNI